MTLPSMIVIALGLALATTALSTLPAKGGRYSLSWSPLAIVFIILALLTGFSHPQLHAEKEALAAGMDFPLLLFLCFLTFVGFGLNLIAPRGQHGRWHRFQISFLCATTILFVATADTRVMLGAWILSLVPTFLDDTEGGVKWRGIQYPAFFAYQILSLSMFIVAIAILHTEIETTQGLLTYNIHHFAAQLMIPETSSFIAGGALVVAVFARQGLFPFHAGVVSLASRAPMSYTIPYLVSQSGFLLFAMLGKHVVKDLLEHGGGAIYAFSAASAIYFALLTLVQTNIRRFWVYLTRIGSTLVPVFYAAAHHTATTGVLLSSLALLVSVAGFGATIWMVERRTGLTTCAQEQGLAQSMPILSGMFLIFGICCVNAPLTLGFVTEDLLLHGVMENMPMQAIPMLIGFAIGGIAVYRFYTKLFLGKAEFFTGKRDLFHRERIGLAMMLAVLICLGLVPRALIQPTAALTNAKAAPPLVEF